MKEPEQCHITCPFCDAEITIGNCHQVYGERERVLDAVLKDLSERSDVGLAMEHIARERGKTWLRDQLLESLRSEP
jgi:hypothetical protein